MEDYLYHHGILGMKWGKRNGPPYPLRASNHSASEKKAGWRKSLDNNSQDTQNESSNRKFQLTSKQKKAIKVGLAVTGAVLVTYGAYRLGKSGKVDQLKNLGRNKVNSILGKNKNLLAGGIGDLTTDKFLSSKKMSAKESVQDIVKNTNPHRGDPKYAENCTSCSIAAFLRSRGYDVSARDTGGKPQQLGGILEECFRRSANSSDHSLSFVKQGSAIKFAKSVNDAGEMLKKRYGDNASGVVSVPLKGGKNHAFAWSIKDGVVTFFDGQDKRSLFNVPELAWPQIDPVGILEFARLDDLEVIEDAIRKVVQ